MPEQEHKEKPVADKLREQLDALKKMGLNGLKDLEKVTKDVKSKVESKISASKTGEENDSDAPDASAQVPAGKKQPDNFVDDLLKKIPTGFLQRKKPAVKCQDKAVPPANADADTDTVADTAADTVADKKDKSAQSGRSMIEMLGVLAIIGVLSAGGIAGYSMAMNAHKTNVAMQTITDIVARALNKITKAVEADTVYTFGDLVEMGIITETSDTSATKIASSFGTELTADMEGVDGATVLNIAFSKVPPATCVKLLSVDWNTTGPAGTEIAIGTWYPCPDGDTNPICQEDSDELGYLDVYTPLAPSDALNVCGKGKREVDMIWSFIFYGTIDPTTYLPDITFEEEP